MPIKWKTAFRSTSLLAACGAVAVLAVAQSNESSTVANPFAAAQAAAAATTKAPHDPGIRGGFANTGGGLQQQGIPIPHTPVISPNPNPGVDPSGQQRVLSANELALFLEGIKRAGQLESTCDTCSALPYGVGDGNRVLQADGSPFPDELDPDFPQNHTNSNGLGTRHNGDSCLGCHSQPTLGGSGGFLAVAKGINKTGPLAQNPAFALVPNRFGAINTVPSFINQYGPIREARLKYNPDGTRDGSVHPLYVTTGTIYDTLNAGCNAVQTNFAKEVANNNVSLRIPLQILGLGLIESIQDQTILASFNATASERAALSIQGHPNLSPNDATISRFGWKAQNKSIHIFAGEAYNVEMGVNNDILPNAIDENPNCAHAKPEPNDINRTDPTDAENHAFNNPLHELPDWQQFAIMMRLTDGPEPEANPSASAVHGKQVFQKIGCALCHTPTMQTNGTLNTPVLEDRPVNLFSDLMLHHMGPKLADDIVQGAAGPDEFRTVPLWGVGQRMFFLHDGRTSDILQAVLAHAAQPDDPAVVDAGRYPPSEATAVLNNFQQLSVADKQAILDFLRSL